MDIHEYIPLAVRTASEKPLLGIDGVSIKTTQLLHACIGVAGELLEFANTPLGQSDLEEIGDIMWYCALGMHASGVYMELSGRSLSASSSIDEAEEGWNDLMIAAERLANNAKRLLFYGYSICDRDIREMGDLFWQAADATSRFCYARQITVGAVMDSNIRKLRKRYPDRFSVEASMNRDVEAERLAMQ